MPGNLTKQMPHLKGQTWKDQYFIFLIVFEQKGIFCLTQTYMNLLLKFLVTLA